MAVVGHQRSDLIYVPNMVLVGKPMHGFARLWIALISQLSVTIDGMATAPPQFVADGRLAGAGNAFDQIVSDAHPMFSSPYT